MYEFGALTVEITMASIEEIEQEIFRDLRTFVPRGEIRRATRD
jgi:hypothetical protein